LFYSGDEIGLNWIQAAFDHGNIDADLQIVPLTEVVPFAKQQKPTLIIVGHRPVMQSGSQERWRAAGCPTNWDIVRALKSDSATQEIPVLMLVHKIVPEDWKSGADSCLDMPTDYQQFLDTALNLLK
jgi:hypothetical protein